MGVLATHTHEPWQPERLMTRLVKLLWDNDAVFFVQTFEQLGGAKYEAIRAVANIGTLMAVSMYGKRDVDIVFAAANRMVTETYNSL